MMSITTVSRNFQVTVPKDIREQLGLTIGEKVVMVTTKTGVVLLKKLKKSPVDRAFGNWKAKETGIEYMDKFRDEWEKR